MAQIDIQAIFRFRGQRRSARRSTRAGAARLHVSGADLFPLAEALDQLARTPLRYCGLEEIRKIFVARGHERLEAYAVLRAEARQERFAAGAAGTRVRELHCQVSCHRPDFMLRSTPPQPENGPQERRVS